LWGSLAGAAFVTLLPNVLGALDAWRDIIHGLIVVLVLTLLPRGLLTGLVDLVRKRAANMPAARG
jgi:branched-chain amino acid transport system permease protein